MLELRAEVDRLEVEMARTRAIRTDLERVLRSQLGSQSWPAGPIGFAVGLFVGMIVCMALSVSR